MPTTRGQKGREPERKTNPSGSENEINEGKKSNTKRQLPAKNTAISKAPEVEEAKGRKSRAVKEEKAPRSRTTRATKASAAEKTEEVVDPVELEHDHSITVVAAEEFVSARRGRTGRTTQAAASSNTADACPAAKTRGQSMKAKATSSKSDNTAPATRGTRRRRLEVDLEPEIQTKSNADESAKKPSNKHDPEPEFLATGVEIPPRKSSSSKSKNDEIVNHKAVEQENPVTKTRTRGRLASKVPSIESLGDEEDSPPSPVAEGHVFKAVAPPTGARASRAGKRSVATAELKAKSKPTTRATGRTKALTTVTSKAKTVIAKKPTIKTTAMKAAGREPKSVEVAPFVEDEGETTIQVQDVKRIVTQPKSVMDDETCSTQQPAVEESVDPAMNEEIQVGISTDKPEELCHESAPELTVLCTDLETPLSEPQQQAEPLVVQVPSKLLDTSTIVAATKDLVSQNIVVEEAVSEPEGFEPCTAALFDNVVLDNLATPAQKAHQPSVMSSTKEAYQADSLEVLLEEDPAFSMSIISFDDNEIDATADGNMNEVDFISSTSNEELKEETQQFVSQAWEELINHEATRTAAAENAALHIEMAQLSMPDFLAKTGLYTANTGRRMSDIVTPSLNANNAKLRHGRRQSMFPRVTQTCSENETVGETGPVNHDQEKETADVSEAGTTKNGIASPIKLAAIDEAQLLAVAASPFQRKPATQAKQRRVSFMPGKQLPRPSSSSRRRSMFPYLAALSDSPLEQPSAVVASDFQETLKSKIETEEVHKVSSSTWVPANKPVSGLKRVSISLASPRRSTRSQSDRRKSMYPAAASGKVIEKELADEPSVHDSDLWAIAGGDNLGATVIEAAYGADIEQLAPELDADVDLIQSKPLTGTTWYVSVYNKGECANDLWVPGLEALGASINQNWHESVNDVPVTHILFNNGSRQTLQRAAEAGAKCVKISYVLDVESSETFLNEDDPKYRIDLSKHTVVPEQPRETFVPCSPAKAPSLRSPATPKSASNSKENLPPFFLSPYKKTPLIMKVSPKVPLGMRTCPPKQLMQPILGTINGSPKPAGKNIKRRLSFDHSGDRKRPNLMSPLKSVTLVPTVVEEDSWLI